MSKHDYTPSVKAAAAALADPLAARMHLERAAVDTLTAADTGNGGGPSS